MKRRTDRIGEERIMNNGLKAKIIGYRNIKDIDIEFEDGYIVEHTLYSSFQGGRIRHEDITTNSFFRIGEVRTMQSGAECKIIEYRNSCDIDVEFEDGTIVRHKEYKSFVHGLIRNKNITASKHIGKSNTMNNGMRAVIVNYRAYGDIDVEFEDGVIVKHRAMNAFKAGKIRHP